MLRLIFLNNNYQLLTQQLLPDIVTQYQIPSAPIPPSQQQLPIADPTTAPADIVTQYQIPSATIPPSQQQLPIADPTTAA